MIDLDPSRVGLKGSDWSEDTMDWSRAGSLGLVGGRDRGAGLRIQQVQMGLYQVTSEGDWILKGLDRVINNS